MTALSRRFVVLSGLRWFPIGLIVPVLVLSFTARGLELPTIGRLMALYGIVTLALELPTGGLSDVVGRRSVLALGSMASGVGAAVVALSSAVPGFAFGVVAMAIGRALGSGPLESWYVDTSRALDPETDIGPGIAHAQAADGIGLGVGSLVGGMLPAAAAALWPALPDAGDAALITFSVPTLVASLLFGVHAVAVVLFVHESERPPVAWRRLTGSVTSTVGEGARLVKDSSTLRRLVGYSVVLGVTMGGVELVSPGAFASMLGGGEKGSAAYGVLVGIGFGVSALGAVLAPRVARRLGTSQRATRLVALLVVPAVLLIGVPWFGAAALAYTVLYLLLGVNGPLLATLLHDEVTAAARNTVLSVDSLAIQAGGIVSSLLMGALVGATSAAAGFAVMSAVAAVGTVMLWQLHPSRAVPTVRPGGSPGVPD